jgi:5-formyltetrahydrofolate cyclo-ligase
MPLHRTDKAIIGARVRALQNRAGEIECFVPTQNEIVRTDIIETLRARDDRWLEDRRRSETQRRA